MLYLGFFYLSYFNLPAFQENPSCARSSTTEAGFIDRMPFLLPNNITKILEYFAGFFIGCEEKGQMIKIYLTSSTIIRQSRFSI